MSKYLAFILLFLAVDGQAEEVRQAGPGSLLAVTGENFTVNAIILALVEFPNQGGYAFLRVDGVESRGLKYDVALNDIKVVVPVELKEGSLAKWSQYIVEIDPEKLNDEDRVRVQMLVELIAADELRPARTGLYFSLLNALAVGGHISVVPTLPLPEE